MNKTVLVWILFSILFVPAVTLAQIEITEIMYDLSGTDTDREWVEIYNNGTEKVLVLTGSGKGSWRFVDASPHTINTYVENLNTIEPGEFALIVKDGDSFKNEYPNYTGVLFTSPLSLVNTGTTIYIKDGDGNILDSVTYNSSQGANGDGNSLQKNASGNWIAAAPTPGGPNGNASSGEVLGASTQVSSQSGVTSSSASATSFAQSGLDVVAGGDRFTSVGSPITFQAIIKKNTIQNAGFKFAWSYGDGYVGEGQVVTHTYRYPGEYAVVLSTRAGSVVSTNRFKVRVVETNIGLSKNSQYIEIENKSNNEISLFNWKLVSRNMGFMFQPETIILPKSSIKIPLDLLKMKGEAESNTVLKDYLGDVVATFEDPISKEEIVNLQNSLAEAEAKVLVMRSGIESRSESISEVVTKNQNFAAVVVEREEIQNSVDPNEDLGTVLFESSPKQSFISKIILLFKSIID